MKSHKIVAFTCRICGYTGWFMSFVTKDYNHANDERFRYCICPACGCMQIKKIPDDLEKYYGDRYYSFHTKSKNRKDICGRLIYVLMVKRDLYELEDRGWIGRMMAFFISRPAYRWIRTSCGKEKKILDVGCGDGYLLELLSKLGYRHLTGVDKFSAVKSTKPKSGIKMIRGTLEDCGEEYDRIMFHHSLEHMDDPQKVLCEAAQRLTEYGQILLALPLAGSNVFKEFGRYWVQLDAPRHLYLHSIDSLRLMADNAGLKIDQIIYDSNAFSYIGSIQYKKRKNGRYRRSFCGLLDYAILALLKYSKKAAYDNKQAKGDQATIILVRR